MYEKEGEMERFLTDMTRFLGYGVADADNESK
jgi:hypothetical protein